MLRMARVCEGTVHPEEISKQYLESVKAVKQVDAIHQHNHKRSRSNGKGRGGHRSHSRSQSRKPGGNCSNCGTNHPPRKCKAYGKECFHCHKKGHFSQLCHSKQHGRSPGPGVRTQNSNNRHSHRGVHEIDQSQFDDAVQFEQDSVTIQFKTQLRHKNMMFGEVSTAPLLQRILTDIYVSDKQTNWLKCRFKIDSGACGNLMIVSMCKSLYNRAPPSTSVSSAVRLLDYNRKEIKQLGTCYVYVRFRSTIKCVHFYVVPDRLKPIIGVSDALSLGLTSFHCRIFNDWHTTSDIDSIQDSGKVNSKVKEFTLGPLIISPLGALMQQTITTGKVNSKVKEFTLDPLVVDSLGMLTKQIIINNPKYAHLFSGIGHFKCRPVHIMMRQGSVPIQKPPRRVPIAMKEKFKQELDSMEAQGIISKYDGRNISSEWLNSFVIVKKPKVHFTYA